MSILLGFILASVGLDIVTGQLRLTFGSAELMKGFDFIVAVIGLFGIGEILLTVEEGLPLPGRDAADAAPRVVLADVEGCCRATGGRSCGARSSASGWASSRAAPPPPRS